MGDPTVFGGPFELVVPPAFDREVLFVYADDAASVRVTVNDAILKAAGMIVRRTALTEAERVRFVLFASLVDDGEAQAIALAEARKLPLLSDDVLGLRLAASVGVSTLTTLDLLVLWARDRGSKEIRETCLRLRKRARYGVPRDHQHADWYRSQLEEPEN